MSGLDYRRSVFVHPSPLVPDSPPWDFSHASKRSLDLAATDEECHRILVLSGVPYEQSPCISEAVHPGLIV
jgi:hypothetical protein